MKSDHLMKVYKTDKRILSIQCAHKVPGAMIGQVSDGKSENLRVFLSVGHFTLALDSGPRTPIAWVEVQGRVMITTSWVDYEPRLSMDFAPYDPVKIDSMVRGFEEWRKGKGMIMDEVEIRCSSPKTPGHRPGG